MDRVDDGATIDNIVKELSYPLPEEEFTIKNFVDSSPDKESVFEFLGLRFPGSCVCRNILLRNRRNLVSKLESRPNGTFFMVNGTLVAVFNISKLKIFFTLKFVNSKVQGL